MKLLFCPACQDIRKLSVRNPTVCECGQSGGRYLNDTDAELWGQAIPLGFDNLTLALALRGRPEAGPGEVFRAFVIPRQCQTIRQLAEAPPEACDSARTPLGDEPREPSAKQAAVG